MADHRAGKGQILSVQQLAERLAVPCFYILVGKAVAAFPESSTPSPSSFVQIVRIGPVAKTVDVSMFPVTVNWRQWRDIVVPLLEEGWEGYLGLLGGHVSLTNYGIPTINPGRGVFACAPDTRGLHDDLVGLMRLRLIQIGTAAGYG